MTVSRRGFVTGTVGAGLALVVGISLARRASAEGPAPPVSPLDTWVRIDRQGITLISAKSEMGQGVFTSLPMILAEELDADWQQIRVEQALVPYPNRFDHGTGGSGSVKESWVLLRQAGAAARQMLIAAAALNWGVDKLECSTGSGRVTHPSGKSASYTELAETAASLPVPDLEKVPLKDPKAFRIVGQSVPKKDIPAKVNGTAIYGIDVRVPGMKVAVIERCPIFGGTLKRYNDTRTRAVPGVKAVIAIPAVERSCHSAGGVAVVADSTWSALQGRRVLSAEWQPGPEGAENSEALLTQYRSRLAESGMTVRKDGEALAALNAAGDRKDSRSFHAVYELPFLAHAAMEPLNCVADVRTDRAELWAAAQLPSWVQAVAARVLELPREAITLHIPFLGGGFGRRGQVDFAIEAAQVSKAIGGPVQVVWTREDDMRHDFYRQASFHELRAALDTDARVTAWHHRIFSTSIREFWDPPERLKAESQEVTGAINVPYALPNALIEYTSLKSTVPRAWWRAVEDSFNPFAVECFIDELAAGAKVDPVEFRLALLAGKRLVGNAIDPEGPALDTSRLSHVLRLAASSADWGKSLPAGRARGVACHYSFYTYVAQVAEVSVSKEGDIKVHRVTCAVDCGRAIHPDGVRAQMEGSIIFGLSAALFGEIKVVNGGVLQSNFHDYPLLRMDRAPLIEVHLVESSADPTGVGEPGVGPVAPALCNAIFAATGKRVRRLPVDLKAQ